jgi:flagellar biosynthesis/type III secretory pathway chaperone
MITDPSGTMMRAAERLVCILEQENRALAAMDLAAAGRFVAEKQAALAALNQADGHAPANGAGYPPATGALPPRSRPAVLPLRSHPARQDSQAEIRPDAASLRPIAERLRVLAAENRVLLERALMVQQRIIGIVARAMQPAAPEFRYGANGGLAVAARARAFALSARA